MTEMYRRMTAQEEALVRWMLSHGGDLATTYLPQVDLVRVSPRKCPCGCASFDLVVPGDRPTAGGIGVLAEFVFGDGNELSGIFIFERESKLAGVEVTGYSGDAPKELPAIESIRPW
ncbi:hypothetical protein ABZR86_13990 [Dyella marensis]|uniref:hypothetical protein n=1 Tax=Dyella TaxID=231454 RepID=UPI0011602276|nr:MULTISPECIES: hypothetical protein [Dyella]